MLQYVSNNRQFYYHLQIRSNICLLHHTLYYLVYNQYKVYIIFYLWRDWTLALSMLLRSFTYSIFMIHPLFQLSMIWIVCIDMNQWILTGMSSDRFVWFSMSSSERPPPLYFLNYQFNKTEKYLENCFNKYFQWKL